MKILKISDKNILNEARDILKGGGLIIYPTDTCYGAGIDVTNEKGIDKLLKYKRKDPSTSIPILIKSKDEIKKFGLVPDKTKIIVAKFLPGPFTFVIKSTGEISQRLLSEKGSVAIRIPNNKFIQELLNKIPNPITSTTANPSGTAPSYSINDLLTKLTKKQIDLIDLIIDGGELGRNSPSTVILSENENPEIIRTGDINPLNFELIDEIESKNVSETENFGESFSKLQNRLILLNGEMGAGKTHFVKGFARGLGINSIIKSPTYTYMNEYKIPQSTKKLIHIDLWRVDNKEELINLGLDKVLNSEDIVIIEWSSILLNFMRELVDESINLKYIDFVKKRDDNRLIKIFIKNK